MGTLIPPGGQVVAYVRSTGVQSGDDNDVRRRLLPTLNAAMALCRSGMDDVIVTAAADDLVLSGLHMFGATAGESTTLVRLVGADRLVMRDCKLQAATSSTTVGVVQFLTTASLDVEIDGCIFQNRKAASVHAVTGMAGATGVVRGCAFGILDNATLAGLVTPGDLMGFGNYVVNLAGEQGSQAGTAGWPVST
jgi:hypothetical protein